jgi:glucose-1-phosphatase
MPPGPTSVNASGAIRLVCFDVGGVLIRARGSFPETIVAAGLPLRLPEPQVAACFDCPEARDVRQRYRTGQIREHEYVQALSDAIHGVYSPQEILSIRDAWLLGPHPETGALLREVRQVPDIRLAVLSNTCLEHWPVMCGYPWRSCLDYAFASHELGLAKPAPEIYRTVENVTSTPPRRILFFDDLEENVAGARECGWNAVRIDPLGIPARQMRAALFEWRVLATGRV